MVNISHPDDHFGRYPKWFWSKLLQEPVSPSFRHGHELLFGLLWAVIRQWHRELATRKESFLTGSPLSWRHDTGEGCQFIPAFLIPSCSIPFSCRSLFYCLCFYNCILYTFVWKDINFIYDTPKPTHARTHNFHPQHKPMATLFLDHPWGRLVARPSMIHRDYIHCTFT